jgi:uncharacterized protein YdaU (DUF1376 family)
MVLTFYLVTFYLSKRPHGAYFLLISSYFLLTSYYGLHSDY